MTTAGRPSITFSTASSIRLVGSFNPFPHTDVPRL
jgi:hypothetical protein